MSRFAPAVETIPLVAPWTAFTGKYRLNRWSWRDLGGVIRSLRSRRLDDAVSARSDPRDHILMRASAARLRRGFPRAGSGIFLNKPLADPANPHRAERWAALAAALGIAIDSGSPRKRAGRRIVIHTGAAQSVRMWPRDRFEALARRLRDSGWETEIVSDGSGGLQELINTLDSADRFIGNDSGPGHIAALLGVPTFTIFGPQLPGLFAPRHPDAAWIEGAPCPYKPCSDNCRFPEPYCITSIGVDAVHQRVNEWLGS